MGTGLVLGRRGSFSDFAITAAAAGEVLGQAPRCPAELGLVLDSAMSRHGTGEPGILVILIFLGCKYSVCSFPNAQEEYLLIAKPFCIMFY